MAYYDWRELGSDILDIVDDAVETKDFHRLNQNVQSVIRKATGTDSYGQNSWSGGSSNSNSGTQYQSGGRANSSGTSRGTQQQGQPYPNQAYPNQGQPYPNRAYPNQAPPNSLFRRTGTTKLLSGLAVLGGLVVAGGSALMVLGLGLMLGGAGGYYYPSPALFFLFLFFLACLAGGLGVCVIAGRTFLRTRRFGIYRDCLGNRTCVNLTELAQAVGKSVKYVRKDLSRMIEKGWFLQGHLDEEGTCLMTDHVTYQQYLALCERRKEMAREEEEARRQAEEEEAAARARKESSPELAEILEEGNRYIKRIHACNDAIPGEEISEKISRMEHLIRRIFDRVEQHPEVIPDIRRLMQYYLPTTVKLLDAYAELDDQPIDGEHIQSSRKEIEDTLDTLNMAYEKLLDSLFRDTAWDVSSDISVLKTMLAQEGLTEDDFAQSRK